MLRSPVQALGPEQDFGMVLVFRKRGAKGDSTSKLEFEIRIRILNFDFDSEIEYRIRNPKSVSNPIFEFDFESEFRF